MQRLLAPQFLHCCKSSKTLITFIRGFVSRFKMRLSTGTMSVISAIFASAVCALPVDNVYSAATGFLHNPQGEVTKNLYPRGCGWSDLLCRGQSKSTTTAQPGSDASAHLSSVRQTNPIRGSSSSLPHGHTSSSVPRTDLIRASSSSSSLPHGRTPSSGPQTDGGSDPIKESPPSSLPRGRTSSSGPQTDPIRGPSSSSLLHGRPSSSGTQAGMIRESLSSSQTDVGDPNQKKLRLEYTLCDEGKKEFCQDIYISKITSGLESLRDSRHTPPFPTGSRVSERA
ncbi:hypothetical protein C8R42DRAFT_647283 [Lentinula raphanica]|nr:hypothetical protein C8R42DRAFT_647283 [Lentinula raphanica]